MPKSRIGKTGVQFGVKKKELFRVEGPKPTGPPPQRIRMLMSLSGESGSYTMGQCYDSPADVKPNTARSWVFSGAAEEVEV